jgi:hypothetical protein
MTVRPLIGSFDNPACGRTHPSSSSADLMGYMDGELRLRAAVDQSSKRLGRHALFWEPAFSAETACPYFSVFFQIGT